MYHYTIMFVRGDNEEGPAAAITQLIVTIQQATSGFNPTLVGRELVIRPTLPQKGIACIGVMLGYVPQ